MGIDSFDNIQQHLQDKLSTKGEDAGKIEQTPLPGTEAAAAAKP